MLKMSQTGDTHLENLVAYRAKFVVTDNIYIVMYIIKVLCRLLIAIKFVFFYLFIYL